METQTVQQELGKASACPPSPPPAETCPGGGPVSCIMVRASSDGWRRVGSSGGRWPCLATPRVIYMATDSVLAVKAGKVHGGPRNEQAPGHRQKEAGRSWEMHIQRFRMERCITSVHCTRPWAQYCQREGREWLLWVKKPHTQQAFFFHPSLLSFVLLLFLPSFLST